MYRNQKYICPLSQNESLQMYTLCILYHDNFHIVRNKYTYSCVLDCLQQAGKAEVARKLVIWIYFTQTQHLLIQNWKADSLSYQGSITELHVTTRQTPAPTIPSECFIYLAAFYFNIFFSHYHRHVVSKNLSFTYVLSGTMTRAIFRTTAG